MLSRRDTKGYSLHLLACFLVTFAVGILHFEMSINLLTKLRLLLEQYDYEK